MVKKLLARLKFLTKLQKDRSTDRTKQYAPDLRSRGHNKCRVVPDSNHLLGQRWHFAGSFVGPMFTNDVGPMSFCSLGL